MTIFRYLIVSILSTIYLLATTPNDVYTEAHNIKMRLGSIVMDRSKSELIPIINVDLSGALPHHVYSLSEALNQKLGIYMKNSLISGFTTKSYPSTKIAPNDVRELLIIIEQNLDKVDKKFKFEKRKFTGKSPSDVMQEIVFANLWMDRLLAGKVAPQYPYMVTELLMYELERIAKAKGIKIEDRDFNKVEEVKPKDVFSNAGVFYTITSLYDTTKNGTKNPNRPYDILSAEVEVAPIDVFTLSIFILNYFYYLEISLGIDIDRDYKVTLKDNIKPNNVYINYSKLNYMLLQIISKI